MVYYNTAHETAHLLPSPLPPAAVERPGETQRKGDTGVAPHDAAIGQLGSGEQPDQCRLARTVDPEYSKIVTGFKSGVHVVEHGFSPVAGTIDLGDPVERDHDGS